MIPGINESNDSIEMTYQINKVPNNISLSNAISDLKPFLNTNHIYFDNNDNISLFEELVFSSLFKLMNNVPVTDGKCRLQIFF